MGAWGYGAADNDTAGDWLAENLLPQLRGVIEDSDAGPEETLLALVIVLDLGLRGYIRGGDLWEAFDRVVAEDETLEWRNAAHRRKYIDHVRAVLDGKLPGPIGLTAGPRIKERTKRETYGPGLRRVPKFPRR